MGILDQLKNKKVAVFGTDNSCIARAKLIEHCDLFIVLDLGKVRMIIPWTAIREIIFDEGENTLEITRVGKGKFTRLRVVLS